MNKLQKFFIPIPLFIFTFILRLSFIGKGAYSIDTLNLILQSQKTLETLQLHFLFGAGYPLTVLMGSLSIFFFQLFGKTDPVFAINFLAVITTSLSVLVFYLISKDFFSKTSALLISLMLCVNPVFLGLSVYGKSHSTGILFVLLSLLFLFKYKKTFRSIYLIWGAFLFGCVAAARFSDFILLLPAFILFVLMYSPHKTRIINSIFFTLISFFICFVFHASYLLGEGSIEYIKNIQNFTHAVTKYSIISFNLKEIFSTIGQRLIISLTIPSLILSLFGFLLGLKQKNNIFFITLVCNSFFIYLQNISSIRSKILFYFYPNLYFLSWIHLKGSNQIKYSCSFNYNMHLLNSNIF